MVMRVVLSGVSEIEEETGLKITHATRSLGGPEFRVVDVLNGCQIGYKKEFEEMFKLLDFRSSHVMPQSLDNGTWRRPNGSGGKPIKLEKGGWVI